MELDPARKEDVLAVVHEFLEEIEHFERQARDRRMRIRTMIGTWELCSASVDVGFCCGNPFDCRGGQP